MPLVQQPAQTLQACLPGVVSLLLFKAISSGSAKPYQTDWSLPRSTHVSDYISGKANERRLGLPSLGVTR